MRYWNLPDTFNTQKKYDEKELLAEFEKRLKKAIQYRTISDVPLGSYLSGGVDSSLISAVLSQEASSKISTYTVGFEQLNEFQYSRIISQKYNTQHTELLIDKKTYFDHWDKLIRFKDGPLSVPNEIPLSIMSRKLKEKITVVLSGEGADELMGGYGKIFRSAFDYGNHIKDKSFYDYFISNYDYVPREIRNKWINDNFKEEYNLYRNQFDQKINSEFTQKSNEENIFRFFYLYHVKGLLQRIDTSTMLASVEARVPFLDHTLVEFVYTQIPYDLKLKWKDEKSYYLAQKSFSKDYSEILDTPKYLLRQLAYKYLPAEIVDRKKMGFPVPLTDWFNDLQDLSIELLTGVDWLNRESIDSLIKHSKSNIRSGQILWMFINIALFERNYFHTSWKW